MKKLDFDIVEKPSYHKTYKIYINPAAELIETIILKSEYKELRGVLDKIRDNLFIWDSNLGIHSEIVHYLRNKQGISISGSGDNVVHFYINLKQMSDRLVYTIYPSGEYEDILSLLSKNITCKKFLTKVGCIALTDEDLALVTW